MYPKKSFLVINKSLRLFAKTLTVDEKHYLLNRDNLTQPVQMQLYQEQKILHFKHLPKNDALIAVVFVEIPVPKNMVRKMPKKPCFRRPLDRQHGKWVESLLQSEWQHLYNIY